MLFPRPQGYLESKHVQVPKTQRTDHVPNRVPLQPGECRDAVHWFVDSVGLYQGSVRGLFLSDYSEDQEALLESAVINFKSRGVTTMVVTGEMLYKQADYLFPHAIAQSPFGRPLLSKMELDMLDADVLIVKDLNAPETPQQLWYLYHHLLYPRALSQRTLLISTQLGYEEFLGYGAMCEDLEYAGRKVTWEKVAWLLDCIMIDLHHFRQVHSENLPPMLKVEYYLYKAVASRGLTLTPQYVLGDYSVDFALMERKGNKLAIECDVLASLDQPNAGSADAKRTLVLLSDGWKLLRFTSVELLANLGACVEAVEEAWVHGYKRAPAGRLISGQQTATVLDLPVEDDVQRLAITNGAGPVAITGGAGTGKSSCITRRVVHLLNQGVNPERILVVSHSTESVRALRGDVETLLDRQQAQKVAFYSWNELGLKLLKENTAAIKRKPPLKVEANPQRIIQRLLTKYKKDLDQLTLELSEELEEFTIASLISLYKANLVTPRHVKERAKGNVDELVARVYQGYEEQLQKSNKIDRDDMVSLAAQLLADNDDIRARYQYQYEFVLIDEFQDATAAADLLARILALPQDNLYIAGDEDESIFESKGALPRILSEISVRLPNARCYVLERNWRCHPIIVNAARKVLTGLNRRKILKDMVPGWESTESQAIVGPYLAESEAQEAEWVASEIQLLLDTGRNPQDVAILYRYNRYASLVEEALFRKGIKCLTTNPDSTMVPDEVADVMAFLRLVMDPDGPKARESFERVCQLRTKEVDPKLFGTIASFAEANNLSFLKAVEIYSEAVADQSCMDLSQLVRIIRTMNHENLPPSETIALLKRTQRLTEYYKSVKVPPGVNYEPMRKLGTLEEEARKFKTVTEFVRSQQNLLKANDSPDSEPLVYILSLHEAKGKEYPIVFLTGMAEGLFPSETANDPEEERRLCYLGMSRAREVLYLSYPNQFNNITLEPSRYLFDADLVGPNLPPIMVNAGPGQVGNFDAQSPQGVAAQLPIAPLPSTQNQINQSQAQPNLDQNHLLRMQEQQRQQAALQAQQAAAIKAQQDAALKAQQEAALKAQQEAALKAQQEAALKAQQEAALKAQQEAALKAQQEQLLLEQEQARKAAAQNEAILKAQQEQMLKNQQAAILRAQQEQQEKQLREQQEAIRLEQEATQRAQQEAQARAAAEAAARAQHDAAMLAQAQQQAERAQQEAAMRAQQEAAQRAHMQQQIQLRGQQDEKMRQQQEAQLRAQNEAHRQAQQEFDLRAQHEAQVRARLEASQKAQQAEKQRTSKAAQEDEAGQIAAMFLHDQQVEQTRLQQAQMQQIFGRQQPPQAPPQAMTFEEALAQAQAQHGTASSQAAAPESNPASEPVSAQLSSPLSASESAPAVSSGSSPFESTMEITLIEPFAAQVVAQSLHQNQVQEQQTDPAVTVSEPVPTKGKKGKRKGKTLLEEPVPPTQPIGTAPPSSVPLDSGLLHPEENVGLPPVSHENDASPPEPYGGMVYQAPPEPIPSPTFKPVAPKMPDYEPQGYGQRRSSPTPENDSVPPTAPQPFSAAPGMPEIPFRDAAAAPGVAGQADPMLAFETVADSQPDPIQESQPEPALPVTAAQPVKAQAPLPPGVVPMADDVADLIDPAYDAAYNQQPSIVPIPPQPQSVANATDARQAFWNTVNSAIKSDPRAVPGGGVPQGVSAPIAAYLPPSQPQAPTAHGISCPGCSEYLEPGSRFCGECGYRLETRIQACRLCGAPQEPGAKFCGECGSKSSSDPHAAQPSPELSAQDAEAAEQSRQYELYLSGQKPSQQGWVTKLKKILD